MKRITDAPAVSIKLTMPRPLLEHVDAMATVTEQSRASMIRELVKAGLREYGAWPPQVEKTPAQGSDHV